jgi:hypothetical protein
MAEIVPVLDRWSVAKLAMPQLLLNIPTGATIRRRIEERALQWSESSIDNPFTLAGNAGQRVFGSTAESPTRIGGERTS